MHQTKLKLGALALLVSSLLTISGLLLRGPLITSTLDAQTFAVAAASPTNAIAEMILPLSLVIQLFAFLGLYLYLENEAISKLKFWGMVFSILGNGLFLPFAGLFAFAVPVIGKLYLAGSTDVMKVAEITLSGGPAFVYLIASAFALTLGAILFGIVMWRNKSLPRWLAVIYVAQAFCLSFGASLGFMFELIGSVMLLIASIVFARKMLGKS